MKAIFAPDCGCCGNGEFIEWKCPKCSLEESKRYEKELKKTSHWCLVHPEGIINKKILTLDSRYVRFMHGGTKIRKGTYVQINNQGFIEKAGKPTNIIVAI